MARQGTLTRRRCDAIGVKPKVLAARTRRSLRGLRERIDALAAPWMDIDDNIRLEVDELLAQFDEFERSIEETVKWLHEEVDW